MPPLSALAGEHTVLEMSPTMQFKDLGGAEPRQAATVVLLREGAGGAEVLLTIRPPHLRFMGGAAVFPGGALDSSDLSSSWERASTLSRARAQALLDEPDGARALGAYVCAIREAFEEVGWLPATGPVDGIPRSAASRGAYFLRSCLEAGVVLSTDQLVPVGRWVTPMSSPTRFDTRFFLARVEAGWEPVRNPAEVEACHWLTPRAALDELGAGKLTMAPPTIDVLQRLAAYEDVAAMLEAMKVRPLSGAGETMSVRLSPLVQIVLAPNPGLMEGPGTNTYVVGGGPFCVIDPAVSDELYVESVLAAGAGEIRDILVTHRHPDHIGGVRAIAERTGARVRAFGNTEAGGVLVDEPLSDGDVIEAGGVVLEALHTPGHASDHLCFFERSTASLWSGDNILGEGTSMIAPPDGNMRAYLSSLRRLRTLHIERIFPGHFKALSGGWEVIDSYLEHRAERERSILEALGSGPLHAEEIVRRVYVDTPQPLLSLARYSVEAHLEMAEEDGRVRRSDEGWRLLDR
jgi:glyoxylase-like metal-dependent hydrolase (beta-lactamase superfamily II)/8-oxo-dGTP pyrophosphatase MutT (NUDIX family)